MIKLKNLYPGVKYCYCCRGVIKLGSAVAACVSALSAAW